MKTSTCPTDQNKSILSKGALYIHIKTMKKNLLAEVGKQFAEKSEIINLYLCLNAARTHRIPSRGGKGSIIELIIVYILLLTHNLRVIELLSVNSPLHMCSVAV